VTYTLLHVEECGEIIYSPLLVTKRFIYRYNLTDIIKSIVKLSDFNLQKTKGCYVHMFPLKAGVTHGFNGVNITDGMWNREGTEDVAVLHHYPVKSFKENVAKKLRGGAAHDPNSPLVKKGIADAQSLFIDALSAFEHKSTDIGK